jgi:hypothetical protein
MSGRKNFLVALWATFGLFWAFVAVETARNPVLEPEHGPPLILILQIALVAFVPTGRRASREAMKRAARL